ncbi:MAG: hypothetical protein QOI69_352, partial [Pseudonocardiales bacterium]|nr:hypothetical protein [Pseudonocardiales bacterium]
MTGSATTHGIPGGESPDGGAARPQDSGAERERVDSFDRAGSDERLSDWYLWGPYLSERQGGTVREDYSADGAAWSYL